MKKVAFITSSLTDGGAERNIINLSLFLPQNNFRTDIVSLTKRNKYKEEYGKKMDKLHIYTVLRQKETLSTLEKLLNGPVAIYKLVQILRKGKYDLIIAAHEYNTFYLTVLCATLLRCKSVLIVGNNLYADLESKYIVTRLYHYFCIFVAFRLTSSIICVSEGIKKQLLNTFGVSKRKIELIYNGVDSDFIKAATKPKSISSTKVFKLITIGRLVERKGQLHLLKVLRYLREEEKINAELSIIGSGKLHSELTYTAKLLNLSPFVRIVPLGGGELYKQLASSDIFVLSSYYEGFGNAIVEAMNCGLPIIAVNCNFGPIEILENGKYGILTPVFNEESLSYEKLSSEEKKFAHEIIKLKRSKKLMKHYHDMSVKRALFFSLQKMVKGYEVHIAKLLYHAA